MLHHKEDALKQIVQLMVAHREVVLQVAVLTMVVQKLDAQQHHKEIQIVIASSHIFWRN